MCIKYAAYITYMYVLYIHIYDAVYPNSTKWGKESRLRTAYQYFTWIKLI